METQDTKRNGGTGPGGCLDVEALFAEYVEGTLAQNERARLETHLAHCTVCAGSLEDMRAALYACHLAPEVAPPPRLLARILEETTGKLTWKQRLRVWARPVLEPRLALGLAMALISFSIIFRATGADLKQMSMADLRPSRLYQALDRQAHLAGASAVKYYRDLRIVYEIQTQLQAIRENSAPPEGKQEPQRQKQQPPQPPAQNKWSRQAVYVAAFTW